MDAPTDSGNNVYGGQTAKNIYLGETRIVTKLNSGNAPTYQEEYYKQYYYHSDHLGSASLISDYKGDEYQRIEYTPYGETWVEKTQNTGLEFLPYKFTGQPIDEETGLYYYGARYLSPRYSRWISADPALYKYVSDSSNSTSGGIFNFINLNFYHYCGNNPIKFIDPDGNDHGMPQFAERIMASRASCSYGTTTEIRQKIADNKRTDSWGIYSIRSGTVIQIQTFNLDLPADDYRQPVYGNNIIIQDTDGTFVRYAHLESMNVENGDWVGEGTQIGKMGDTGNGEPRPNKHLHVSVYPSWAYKDKFGFKSVNAITNPEAYIKSGTYPANTKISTPYRKPIIKKDGSYYFHEGTDFSGLNKNLIENWNKGISGTEGLNE